MLSLILLMIAEPAAAQARCGPGYSDAVAQLQLADRGAARHDLKAASAALAVGLQKLGDVYTSPGTLDDTGMHLALAAAREHQGKLKVAVMMKRRVLLERLDLCRQPMHAGPLR